MTVLHNMTACIDPMGFRTTYVYDLAAVVFVP